MITKPTFVGWESALFLAREDGLSDHSGRFQPPELRPVTRTQMLHEPPVGAQAAKCQAIPALHLKINRIHIEQDCIQLEAQSQFFAQ